MSRINPNNYSDPEEIVLRLNIQKTGKLTSIIILKGKNKDCINEAIRVIKSFKIWTPATFKYKEKLFADDMQLTVPIKLKK